MTHEEIAQMIGSSRETVTRLLSERKKKELIRLEGSNLGHPQSTCVGGAGCVELLGSSKRAVGDANRPPSLFCFQEAMRLHVRD
jgi:hypothetical protein